MCGTYLRTQAGVGSHTNPTVADYARPNPTVADYHGPNIKQLNFHFLSTPTPCRGGWGRQNVEAALGKLHVVALHPGARASDVLLLLLLVCPPGPPLPLLPLSPRYHSNPFILCLPCLPMDVAPNSLFSALTLLRPSSPLSSSSSLFVLLCPPVLTCSSISVLSPSPSSVLSLPLSLFLFRPPAHADVSAARRAAAEECEPGHRPLLACLRVPGPAHVDEALLVAELSGRVARLLNPAPGHRPLHLSLCLRAAARRRHRNVCQGICPSTCPCAWAPPHSSASERVPGHRP